MNLCFTWNNDHFKTKIVSHETFQNLINKFVSCETVNKSFLNKLLIVIKFNNYRFLIRWNDNAFNFEVFENNRKQQNKLYLFRCFNRLNEQNIWLDEWWVLYLCKIAETISQRVPATSESKVTPFWGTPLLSACVPLLHCFCKLYLKIKLHIHPIKTKTCNLRKHFFISCRFKNIKFVVSRIP